MLLANSTGWPWREKKIEQQNWRMMDLLNCSGLAMEKDDERKTRLEKMVDTTQLRLALETEEERRA